MREVVENKSKQTVWVLTMLTVMVVLSVYYLVSDPLIPSNMVDNPVEENLTSENPVAVDINLDEIFQTADLIDQIGLNSNELFVSLKLERNKSRSKQLDTYYLMLGNDLSEEAIAGIHGKIEQLEAVEESEFVLEKLLVAEGYADAVVLTNDDKVDVILQAKSLSNSEAVKVIKMVSDRLNVPAVNVHIKTYDK